MKKFNGWNVWNGSLLAILGLLVIIFPKFVKQVIFVLMGLGAIVYGIYNFKITKALYDGSAYGRTIIIRGIISVLIGVCAILFPLAFGEALWAVMIWVLIVYLIISAVLGFYAAALLRHTGIDRKKYIFENIILLLIALVLILISPKILGDVIIRIVGIVTLLVGAALLVYSFVFKKKDEDIIASYEKKGGKKHEQDIEDAVVVVKEEPEDSEENRDSEEKQDDKTE